MYVCEAVVRRVFRNHEFSFVVHVHTQQWHEPLLQLSPAEVNKLPFHLTKVNSTMHEAYTQITSHTSTVGMFLKLVFGCPQVYIALP